MAAVRTLLPPRQQALAPSLAPARARAIPATSRSLVAPRTTRPGGGVPQFRPLAVGAAGGAKKRPGGLAGIFNNISELAAGFVPGIAHFVGEVGKDVVAVPHALFDVARGDFTPSFSKYLPAATSIVQSIGHTAGDVIHPSRFVKAFEEGDLVSKIVEDVGNVALVFGPAAKAVGAGAATSAMTAGQAAALEGAGKFITEATAADVARAGLPEVIEQTAAKGAAGELARVGAEPLAYYTQYRGLAGKAAKAGDLELAQQLNRAGNVVKNVSHLGGEYVGNAPAYPYKLAARGISKVLDVGELGETIASHLPAEVKWRTGQGKVVRTTRGLVEAAKTRLTRQATAGAQLSERLGLTQAEDRAALLSIEIPKENLILWDKLDEGQVFDALNEKFADIEESQRPTVADARVASQYVQRNLPESKLAGIDAVQDKVLRFAQDRTDRAVEAGLHPEQLGTELRGTVVQRHTEELQTQRGRLDKLMGKATEILTRRERDSRIQDVRANDLPDPTLMNRPEIRAGLEAKIGQLDEATNAYNEALADGTDQQRLAAAAKVDVLLDEAEALKQQAGWQRPERSVFTGRSGTIDPNTPPVAEGMVRLWRGEHVDPTQADPTFFDEGGERAAARKQVAGRWATVDREYAAAYPPRVDPSARKLRYVDVPQDVYDRIKGLADQPENIRTLPGVFPQDELVVPPEFMDQLQDYVEGQPVQHNMLRAGRPTGNPSPNENIRIRQGSLAERANVAQQRVDRLQRSMDLVDDKIANVEAELQRSFQERFHTDVNLPGVTQLGNAMFRGTKRIATLARNFATRHGIALPEDLAQMAPDDIAAMFDDVDLAPAERQMLEHSLTAERTLGQIADTMEEETANGRELNSPHRVKDVIDQAELPDAAWPQVEAAWSRYLQRRTNVASKVFNDWTEAQPARYRTAAQDGQRQVSAFMERAERDNADVPGSGDIYLELANETMTTLQDMVDSGFNPQHLTGGREVSGGAALGRMPERRLTGPSMRGEHVRRSGLRQLSTEGYAKVETQQAEAWVKRRRNEHLATTLGRRVDSFPEVQAAMAGWQDLHPGEVMPPRTLANLVAKVTDENGIEYAPMEPSANMTPESMIVPKKVYDAFESPQQVGLGWQMLGRTNRAFKTWVLPWSGRWQVGNAIGNVLQSAMHADVGSVELARTMLAMTKREGQGSVRQGLRTLWANEGRAGDLPLEISQSGLTQGEYKVLFGDNQQPARTRVGRVVERGARASYRFNSFVDDMTRSAVMLAKLGAGEGTDAALRTTLRSLGDYTKMTPLERNKVRQIVPFYSWLKHSLTATMRLPITSPTRAAFYMHLQTLYDQDEDIRKLIGQRFQIGPTSLLNVGSVVPLADVDTGQSLLNPANWGSSLAPGIKFGAAVLGGWDLNRMDRITRPESQFGAGPFGKENTTPLMRLLSGDVAAGLGEIGWQATQQGPSQIRSLRDLALGETTRYSGTGYRTDFTNRNNRSLWQLARVLSLPSVQYEPRLKTGT